MRSNRLWIGVACGVALALSVVAAVVAGTQTAGAATGERLWVRVAADGSCENNTTKNTAKSAASINCTQTADAPNCGTTPCGDYNVDFQKNVQGCAWTATPLLNAGPPPEDSTYLDQEARIAVTARVLNDPNRVRVWVFTAAGALKANSFSVEVLC